MLLWDHSAFRRHLVLQYAKNDPSIKGLRDKLKVK